MIAVRTQLGVVREADVRYYGQDVDRRAVFMAAWNLILHGASNIALEVGDTLRAPHFLDEGEVRRFDLVVAQPPFHYVAEEDFGLNDPYGRFRYGVVLSSRADYAFVQHVVASLAPDGRAAIVMALTALSRSGFEEEIRAHLVHADILEAVITFRGNIALGKNVPAAVLTLNLNKPREEQDSIYFLDAPVEKIIPRELVTKRMRSSVRTTVNMYGERLEKPGLSARVSVERIRAQHYSLAPQAYISQQLLEQVDTAALDKEIAETEQESQQAEEDFKDALRRLYMKRSIRRIRRT